jgi:RND family efflux transporter MFP subunit
VPAKGTVIAAREVAIQPQVAGELVMVNTNLVPGGIVGAGETLVKIDPRDYRVAVEEAQTALAQAQAELKLEQGRQKIAEREWELFKGEASPSRDAALALRQPQLESAQAAVEAARARLERAQLNLQRTTVVAPFDAFVRSESAEVGKFVLPQTMLATLVGTEAFWVRASVRMDDVGNIDIPGVTATSGSPVTIRYDAGGVPIERAGRVTRLFGDLDPAGRMARVLIEVRDPLVIDPDVSRRPRVPLLLDAFVDVEIEGNQARELIEVPREAIHEGNEAYVFTPAGTLEIQPVEIAWRLPKTVLVSRGLEEGQRVVVSRIPTPVEGMKLRWQETNAAVGRRD